MSNLAVSNAQDPTPAQIELIKSTVAKGATHDELKLFLYRCRHMGLDPLKPGQIHFVKYGSNPGTIIIGIEGFRVRAAKTGKHAGTKRGVIRNNEDRCIGAWCEVYRSDWSQPAREEVSLSEYNTGKAQWAKMPETMIKKVAECAALRMAFPDELGGVYGKEEMDQAEPEQVSNPLQERREAKAAAEEDPGEYVVPFGKWKGKKVKDLDQFELNSYVKYIHSQAEANGRAITGQVADFMTAATLFLHMSESRTEDWRNDDFDQALASRLEDPNS